MFQNIALLLGQQFCFGHFEDRDNKAHLRHQMAVVLVLLVPFLLFRLLPLRYLVVAGLPHQAQQRVHHGLLQSTQHVLPLRRGGQHEGRRLAQHRHLTRNIVQVIAL